MLCIYWHLNLSPFFIIFFPNATPPPSLAASILWLTAFKSFVKLLSSLSQGFPSYTKGVSGAIIKKTVFSELILCNLLRYWYCGLPIGTTKMENKCLFQTNKEILNVFLRLFPLVVEKMTDWKKIKTPVFAGMILHLFFFFSQIAGYFWTTMAVFQNNFWVSVLENTFNVVITTVLLFYMRWTPYVCIKITGWQYASAAKREERRKYHN